MSGELLFEIGCEELPASYAMSAIAALPAIVARELGERGLEIAAGDVRVAGTPRRLAVGIASLPESTPKKKRVAKGPPKSAAYKDGAPTKAAEGFAQKNGVPVERLQIVKDEKGGEYIAVELEEGGRSTAEVLAEALPKVIESIPFPKVMRWASMEFRFARPVRWLVAAFGGKPVAFSWGGCEAGLFTQGHRFLAPGPVAVKTWAEYEAALDKAHVMVDPAKRKARVRELAEKAARAAGGELERDDALLDVVSFLVEEPHPIVGSFEKKLLALPKEVIVTPMKHHQRYFPVLDGQGGLAASFVTIANVPPRDPGVVAHGNERVLRARLADAQFFFDEDLGTPLERMVEGLAGLTFQEKLGSYRDKVDRMKVLAVAIRDALAAAGLKEIPANDKVEVAVELAKADLKSKMVYEFPELQGLMGRAYAKAAGGGFAAAADAIAEHYQPRFAGDAIPASALGAIVSLADRFDTLAGIFGIGEKPTGSADPYGLRRHALAVIAIVRGKGWPLSISTWLRTAADNFESRVKDPTRAAADALEFVKGRLENALRDEGLPFDAVDAALAAGFDDVNDAVARARAVADVKTRPEFESIAIAFKRASNIVRDAKPADRGATLDAALFAHETERALKAAFDKVAEKVAAHKAARRYADALVETLALKDPIDAFFNAVMVNDKDEKVRRNRFALLTLVVALFRDVADFSKLAG